MRKEQPMTPLVLFSYRRPHLLVQVVKAITNQTQKPDHIIYCNDGPPDQQTRACETLIDDIGIPTTKIIRQVNHGCAPNIMSCLNELVNGNIMSCDRFVVLEDDVVPANSWYQSMCILLNRYDGDPNVGAVGGFPSIMANRLRDRDVIASPRFSCWGWGSWNRKWLEASQDWYHYMNHARPPWDPLALPHHAGSDIGQMVAHSPPGTIWDGVMAGAFLHRKWLQVITRYYLTNNIGAGAHIPESSVQWMMDNSKMDDRIPTVLPDAELHQEVCHAVCEYVNR